MKKGTILAAVLGLPTVFGATTTPTIATAEFIDPALYDGGKARVNRSASLRALSESVAAASCRFHGGIDTDNAKQHLAADMDRFNVILAGLEHGNPALGIPTTETRGRTLATIQETIGAWTPIAASAARLVSDRGTETDAAAIADGRAALFEQTVVLAAEISGQYSNPQELLQSDATILNFAGRQRALAHRMSRAICQLATGTGGPETLADLETAADLFERTLVALRSGMPEAGINPPPTDAVADSLDQTLALWQEERGFLDAFLAGQTPGSDDVIAVTDLAHDIVVSMNNTITLYLIATPGKQGTYRVPLEAYAKGELANWLTDPALIAAINAQNVRHADLSDDEVIALDQEWRAEAGADGGPLISGLLEHPVSEWLRSQQTGTAGFVTEVFVMDNKGLNVAQSVETSDYWQGDEAKWQETYLVGAEALHVGDVEFDDSTGFYQSQASLPIVDPATGAVIGAITFGINVQNLM
ncbi:type IV pili methyl-accepting chemotaxis transducer N-terminal domain-containing protein [Yoonia sp. BS5-3]|uniref:Type IV pili methyl-accepting chemotaxis transducer N-terminal domain-containing protein n=1 Tax=Yoonia phaeophyticola TaxID=3137369 RepID=A0ABZ2V3R8_9RHOB